MHVERNQDVTHVKKLKKNTQIYSYKLIMIQYNSPTTTETHIYPTIKITILRVVEAP